MSSRALGRARPLGPHGLRRALQALWRHSGVLVVAATWVALAGGRVSPRALLGGDLLAMAALALLGAALVRAVRRELHPEAPRPGLASARDTRRHELELGLILLTCTYALIHLTGGARSFLYPLVYALVSFMAILHRSRRVALAWLAAACALELLTGHVSGAAARVGDQVASHLTFIGFFAAGNALVLSSLVRRLRTEHRRQVQGELTRMRQEARDFRLLAADRPLARRAESREDEETRMAQGAVEGIHAQLEFTLETLRDAMALHACALLWVHERSSDERVDPPRISLKTGVGPTDALLPVGAPLATPGVLAALLREPRPLRMTSATGLRLPPYYRADARAESTLQIRQLCTVPVRDRGRLVAILCADRTADASAPLGDADETRLTEAARQISRVIAQERALATIERDKYEQEQFYRASERLGEALTLEDVYDKTFEAVAAIASYDLAVISSYDAGRRQHQILAIRAPEHDVDNAPEGAAWRELVARLEGLRFEDGFGLVAMAVKNRHSMPADDAFEPESVVFTPRTRLTRARSLLVLPLVRGEQVLGAITLASAQPRRFQRATREMLRVISHQVSVSLQNARMYSSMARRATTDGLTGLTNHRAFQERLATLHALAERTGQKFSLILTDIDHFKRVNDTHGHPVGDAVLRRVARVLSGRSRKVDIVARYGGEEFVIVLPDTDARGAEIFANKLREEVAAQTMTSESGAFHVTISMGIAEYPSDASDRRELIERADQALYRCKESGRDRVIRWRAA